jgi:Immunity protein family (Imm11)
MCYFELLADMYIPGKWQLGTPIDRKTGEIPNGSLLDGRPVRFQGPIRLPLEDPGVRLDFSMADINSLPVMHVRVASAVVELAGSDVQMIPVEIDSQPDQYYIMHVLRVLRCIDDAACKEVRYWKPEDGIAELAGTYQSVIGLRIDTSKVGDAKVFRTKNWEIALTVSEDIKDAMERLGVTGAEFREVG